MSGRNKEKLQQHGNIGQKWDQGKRDPPWEAVTSIPFRGE